MQFGRLHVFWAFVPSLAATTPPFEPAVIFGLMGVKIVENDMDFAAGMCGEDAVHEVEELDPAPPFVMPPRYCAGRHIEGREQRGGPVPFVIVALARQRAPIGKLGGAPRPGSRFR